MQETTIVADVKVHDGKLRFVEEDTPSKGYEDLIEAFLQTGVDVEEHSDGERVGRAEMTIQAANDERLYIDGRVRDLEVTETYV